MNIRSLLWHEAQAPRSVSGGLHPLSARKEPTSSTPRASCHDCKVAIFGMFSDAELARAVVALAVLSFAVAAVVRWLCMDSTVGP